LNDGYIGSSHVQKAVGAGTATLTREFGLLRTPQNNFHFVGFQGWLSSS
jgi:hypothetical protein